MIRVVQKLSTEMFGLKVVEVFCLVQILFSIPPSSHANTKVQDRKFCFFASSELIYENVIKQVAPSAVCEGGGRLLDNKVSLGGVQGVVDDFDSLWGAVFFVDETDYPSILRYAQSRSQLSFMSQARIALPKVQAPAICRTIDLGIISSGFPFRSNNEVSFETTVSQYVERMRQLNVPEKYLRKLTTAQKWMTASFANTKPQSTSQSTAQSNGLNSMRRRVTLKTMNQKSSKRFTPYPTTQYPSADDIGVPEQVQQPPIRSTLPNNPTTNHVTVETTKQRNENVEQAGITQIVTQKQTPEVSPQQQITPTSNRGPVMSVSQNIPGSVGNPVPIISENSLPKPYDQNSLKPEDSLSQLKQLPKSYPPPEMPQTPARMLKENPSNPVNTKLSPQQNSPIEDSVEPLDINGLPSKQHPIQGTPSQILKEDFDNPRGTKPLSQENFPTDLRNQYPLTSKDISQPRTPQSPNSVLTDFPENVQPEAEEGPDRPLIPRNKKLYPSPKRLQQIPEIFDEKLENRARPQNRVSALADQNNIQTPEGTLEEMKSPCVSRPQPLLNSPTEQFSQNPQEPTRMLPNNVDTYDQPTMPAEMKPQELSPLVRVLQNNLEPLKRKSENPNQFEDISEEVLTPKNELPNSTPNQVQEIPKEKLYLVQNPQTSTQTPQQNSQTELYSQNPLTLEDTILHDSSEEMVDQPMKTNQVPLPISSLQSTPGLSDKKSENPIPQQNYPQEVLKQTNSPTIASTSFQNIPERIPDSEQTVKPFSEQNGPLKVLNKSTSKQEDTQRNTLSTKRLTSSPIQRRNVPKEVVDKEIRSRRGSKFLQSQNTVLESQSQLQDNSPIMEVKGQPICSTEKKPNETTSPRSVPELIEQKKEIPIFINPEEKLQDENIQTPQVSNTNKLENTTLNNIQKQKNVQQVPDTTPLVSENVNNPQIPQTSPTELGPIDSYNQETCKPENVQSPQETNDQTISSTGFTPAHKKVGQPLSRSPGNTPEMLEEKLQDENIQTPQLSNTKKLENTTLNNIQKQKNVQQVPDTSQIPQTSPTELGPTDSHNQETCKPENVQSPQETNDQKAIVSPESTPAHKEVGQASSKALSYTSGTPEDESESSIAPQNSSRGFTKPKRIQSPLQSTPEELSRDRDVNLQDFNGPLPLQDGPSEQDSPISPKPESIPSEEQMTNPTMKLLSKKSGKSSPKSLTYTNTNLTPLKNNPRELMKSDTAPTPLENSSEELEDNISSNPQNCKSSTLPKGPMEQYNQVSQKTEDLEQEERTSNSVMRSSSKKLEQPSSNTSNKLENPTQLLSNQQGCKTQTTQNNLSEQSSQIAPQPEEMLPQEQALKALPKKSEQFISKQPVNVTNTMKNEIQSQTPLQENPQRPTTSRKGPTTSLDDSLEDLMNGTFSNPRNLNLSPSQNKPNDFTPGEQISNPTMTPLSKKLGQTPISPENISKDLQNEKTQNPVEFKPLPLQNSPTESSNRLPENLEDETPDEQISGPQTIPPSIKSSKLPEENLLERNPVENLENSSITEPLPQQNDSTNTLESKLEEKTQKVALDLHKTIKEVLSSSPNTSELPDSVTATSSDDSNTLTIEKDGQVLTSSNNDSPAPTELPNALKSKLVTSESKHVESKHLINRETETLEIDKPEETDAPESPIAEESSQTQVRNYTNTKKTIQETERLTQSNSNISSVSDTFDQLQVAEGPVSSPNDHEMLIPGYTLGPLVPEFDILSAAVEPTFLKRDVAVSQAKSTANARPQQTQAKSTASVEPQRAQAKSTTSAGMQQTQAKSTASVGPQQAQVKNAVSNEPQQVQAKSMVSIGPQQTQAKSAMSNEPQQAQAKSMANVGLQQTQAKSVVSNEPQQAQAKSTASVGPQQTQTKSMASAGMQKPCLQGSPTLDTNTLGSTSPVQATNISTADASPGKVTTTPISTPNVTGINIQKESPNGISSTTHLTSKDGSNKVATTSVSSSNGSSASGMKVMGIQTKGTPGGSVSSSSVVSVVN